MNGDEPFLPDLEIPEGMAPGSPRTGPDLHLHAVARAWARRSSPPTGINAALFARLRTGRGQHVETSMLQAALCMTASKWQRAEHDDAPGFRTWIYDRRATKGFFRCADGRWIQQWVPNPKFALSSADGDTLELRRDVDNVRDDPDRVPPDPENIVVLAHYYPQMAEAFAKFPSDDWVRVAARSRRAAAAGAHAGGGARRSRAASPRTRSSTSTHPEHGTLRQAGILYGLSRTPGRVQGPVPRASASTPTRSAPRPRRARAPDRSRRAASDPTERRAAPLEGVTVLDLGFAVAGPFGTQVLADLGANVIKVNAWRDPWWHATHIAYGANRGKRSIGIDLKTPEGLAVLHRLVEHADVVHSNMRRDALAPAPLSTRRRCATVNPDLIYCHTRGFDRGPRSDSPGNDQTGCSLAGVTYEDGGGRRRRRAVLEPHLARRHRQRLPLGHRRDPGALPPRRTGEPQAVDTSILNAGLLVASMASVNADGTRAAAPASRSACSSASIRSTGSTRPPTAGCASPP